MSEETDKLNKVLHGVGASKIIYSLVTPEGEDVKSSIVSGDVSGELDRMIATGGSLTDKEAVLKAVKRAQSVYLDRFREAWTQKQDTADHEFFDRWLDWVKPISPISRDAFKYQYPTNGASEGLKAMVAEYGARALKNGFKPEIHLFNGEYEGYGAYADASAIEVKKHDRGDWHKAIDEIAEASKTKPVQIYLSQPSALDGNVWKDYDAFMQELAVRAPNAEVLLDLTYVGCIAKEAHIRTDYPNIPAIVFSLSKPTGSYYDRIGGVVAKGRDGQEPYPTLFGNKWFKNLTSLAIGTEFMKRHDVYEIPRKYAPVQEKAIAEIRASLRKQGNDIDIKPSDVFVLATADLPETTHEIHEFLRRPADGKDILRVCLTPTMSEMIGTAKTHEVQVRYTEKLNKAEGFNR